MVDLSCLSFNFDLFLDLFVLFLDHNNPFFVDLDLLLLSYLDLKPGVLRVFYLLSVCQDG